MKNITCNSFHQISDTYCSYKLLLLLTAYTNRDNIISVALVNLTCQCRIIPEQTA
jgi:hypothetical protein